MCLKMKIMNIMERFGEYENEQMDYQNTFTDWI